MTSDNSAPPKLIRALKILRIIYSVLLVPLCFFGLFALFLFIFAIERRLLDWAYFIHHLLVLASMLAAIIQTNSLIGSGRLKTALALYLTPIGLIAGLVLYESVR